MNTTMLEGFVDPIIGVTGGVGIGLYLGNLGLSIEPETIFVPCSEDEEFFCDGWFDMKIGLDILLK